MCMLSFYPSGVMPAVEHIANGAEVNPDGHGYAIAADSGLVIGRGMNADEIIDAFLRDRERYPDAPALFHSRIATSGRVDETGCHPFYVGRTTHTVVAHNGILFDPGKDSKRSDTRIFAQDIMPRRFRNIDNPARMRKLLRFVGTGNRLVILTVNPSRKSRAYLINGHEGVWVDGEWHSNDGYLPPFVSGKWSARWSGGWAARPWDTTCSVCGSDTVDPTGEWCRTCYSCQDCQLSITEECLCYTPTGFTPKDGAASNGYDRNGYDRNGYDRNGYDRDGYDRHGFDRDGIHWITGERFNARGYNRFGYDRDGYDIDGYDINGYDLNGYDAAGYDRHGYNRHGYDRHSFNRSTHTMIGPAGD